MILFVPNLNLYISTLSMNIYFEDSYYEFVKSTTNIGFKMCFLRIKNTSYGNPLIYNNINIVQTNKPKIKCTSDYVQQTQKAKSSLKSNHFDVYLQHIEIK